MTMSRTTPWPMSITPLRATWGAPLRTLSRRRSKAASVALAGFICAVPATAADVAFVEASSEFEGVSQTSAWDALDGKPSTSWCTAANDPSPMLSIVFDEPVTMTHLGVTAGALPGAGSQATTSADAGSDSAQAVRRPKTVLVDNRTHRMELKLTEAPSTRALEIMPPMRGRRVTIQFPNTFDDNVPDGPLCISEILLKAKDLTSSPTQVARRLRAIAPAGRQLLHEWLDDPSAPQRSLLFDVDGTFTFSYTPILEGKPVTLRGKWSASERGVSLDVGGKVHKLQSRITRIDDGESPTLELVLEGEGPFTAVAATYRPAPARFR